MKDAAEKQFTQKRRHRSKETIAIIATGFWALAMVTLLYFAA